MNPIIMHINYCEADFDKLGRSVDDACRKAAEWGYDGIEFRANVPGDLHCSEAEYIDAIAASRARYGIKHILFGRRVAGASSNDPEERAAGIRDAVTFFRMVHDKLGVTVCNTFGDIILNSDKSIPGYDYDHHGSAVATEAQWNNTAESFRGIGDAVAPLGMRIGFETHMNYIHDLPEAAARLVRMVDNPAVGVNMDYGNTVYFTKYPSIEETIRLYGDKLFYIHLKNSVGIRGSGRYPVALCEGEINHRAYLGELLKMGYTGPIGIEAPRGGDREWFARQDLQYFKTLAKEVGLDRG